MRKLLVGFLAFLLISQHLFASDGTFGGIKLLEGYSAMRSSAIDATTWSIEKKGGLKIAFEAGMNEGSWADPKEEASYLWYREQRVNGFTVRFALVKTGLKTVWEPDSSRGLPLGNILLVSFLLEPGESNHTANFSAKLANQQELADTLLMVMTFDPSKGAF
jgi:hypothetical protein